MKITTNDVSQDPLQPIIDSFIEATAKHNRALQTSLIETFQGDEYILDVFQTIQNIGNEKRKA